jgi:hypothetical protein
LDATKLPACRDLVVDSTRKKALLVGYEETAAFKREGRLIRILESGLADASFGSGGVVSFAPGTRNPESQLGRVTPLADGKTLVLVYDDKSHVVRLNPDGSLDQAFGVGGSINVESFGYIAVDEAAGRFWFVGDQPDTGIQLARFWL